MRSSSTFWFVQSIKSIQAHEMKCKRDCRPVKGLSTRFNSHNVPLRVSILLQEPKIMILYYSACSREWEELNVVSRITRTCRRRLSVFSISNCLKLNKISHNEHLISKLFNLINRKIKWNEQKFGTICCRLENVNT